MLKLLGKRSSINVRKVLWALAELDLPYQQEDWGSGFRDTHTAAFKALNPNAMVPVLLDGDFVLWDSHSILRYLANQYGDGSLYPQAAKARAQVDQWLDWQSADLNPSWSYAFVALVRRAEHSNPMQVRASLDRWTQFMAILDARLSQTQSYVAGAEFSLADIAIGLSVDRWFETPFEHPTFEAVAAYYQRLGKRAGFAANCVCDPHSRKLKTAD